MTSWQAQTRAETAYYRRIEREALQRQRELEKKAKERAKLDAFEQARLEVAEFENRIDVLLSVHKDCAEPSDWLAAAAELPPPIPKRDSYYEMRARQTMMVLPRDERDGWEEKIEIGRIQDERAYEVATKDYAAVHEDWAKRVALARKIRAGDAAAYATAVNELSPLAEITHLGSSTEFTVHTPRLLECNLILNSSKVVPAEIKSLTASNRLSTRAMPTARFHEIYQDYVCSCILRVAREMFALLPIETFLITARTNIFDARTGHPGEHPVLSAAVTRVGLTGLNFDRIDPSDVIETFMYRGDFKASRKSGAFLPITPFTRGDVLPASPDSLGLSELLKRAEALRHEIAAKHRTIQGELISTS